MRTTRRFEGQVVVITGGNRGIGASIVQQFLEEGAKVAILSRRDISAFLIPLQRQSYHVEAIETVITDAQRVKDAVARVIEMWGRIDIVVNNAAAISREPVTAMSLESWHSVIDVNVNAPFYLCHAVIPYLIEQGSGTIVNMSSVAAKVGDLTAAPVYGTSKGAVTTLTRSLARQLAPYKIRVNAVAPHAIVTEMSGQWSEEKRASVIATIPLGRMGEAREVASVVLFLASEEATFITGETINVNGGYLMD